MNEKSRPEKRKCQMCGNECWGKLCKDCYKKESGRTLSKFYQRQKRIHGKVKRN